MPTATEKKTDADFALQCLQYVGKHGMALSHMKLCFVLKGKKATGASSRLVTLKNQSLITHDRATGIYCVNNAGARRKKHVKRRDGLTRRNGSGQQSLFT